MIPLLLLLALTGRPATAPGQLIRAAKLGPVQIREIISRFESSRSATREAEFKARKIFVREASASASAQFKRRAVMGVISTLNGNTITLTHRIQTDRVYTVYFDSNTIIKSKSSATSSAALAVGQRIAAVGILKDVGILAKLIHIIPGRTVSPVPTASLSATPTVSPTPAI